MRSIRLSHALLLLACLALLAKPAASGQSTTLVLPFRTVGVSDTTAVVARDLLAGELERSGIPVLDRTMANELPSGSQGCDEIECALVFATELKAAQVVYGSLSRLGGKIIVRAHTLRVGEASAYYSDQLTALTEEDLDTVMRRIAEGIASGRATEGRSGAHACRHV